MNPEKEADEKDKEYEAEFDKLAAGSIPSKPAESGDEKPPDDKDKPAPAPVDNLKPVDSEKSDDQSPAKPEPKADDKPEALEGVAKALKDTKAWATKLAQENAELKKLVESKGKDGASDEKIRQTEASIGDTRKILGEKLSKVYEDYPELKDVLDPLVSLTDSLSGKIENFQKSTDETKKHAELKSHFETVVEPEILKVHSDFRKIAFTAEYMAWIENQSPAMQYAAKMSLDPRDISHSLTEYKKFQASGDADSQRDEDDRKQKGIRENLSSVRGGGSVSKTVGKPTKLEDVDKNDYDSAFDLLVNQK